MKRIAELIHDPDHPDKSNLDSWIANHPGWRTKKYRVYQLTEWPKPEEFDLLVLHGGTQHLWDKVAAPWLQREVDFVRETLRDNCPVLGFCLGSQLVAEAMGGRVFRAESSEIGWFQIELRARANGHPLLRDLELGFTTFLWHDDHYTLPRECDSLAFTAAAPNQIIAGKVWPGVGFQFHPEYSLAMIYDYFAVLDETFIQNATGCVSKQAFLAELKKRGDTYPLFEKLMTNALDWFQRQGVLQMN